ncbi:copper resistance CopC family protein [Herbiconiux solani]|uniref:copper resistance CopC family protein n=1 Tax=Herbiconiux solani TaxID=661329 RepID=UPI00082574A3|nr:copper resistance CopC family protein [Herbiconiux solani]
MRLRTPIALAATAVAALALLAPALAASAHDSLSGSTPAADASITADPGAVSLQFSDDLLAIGSDTNGFAVEVVDSEGMHYESGCVTIDGTSVSAPVALGDAGGYVVLWQVVSSDGHPTSGQYDFDYEPTDLFGAGEGLTSSPVCGDAWAGAPDGATTPAATPATANLATTTPATPAPDAAAADETTLATETAGPVTGDLQTPAEGLPWPVVVLLALVGAGVLAAIVVLVIRRGRNGGGYGG